MTDVERLGSQNIEVVGQHRLLLCASSLVMQSQRLLTAADSLHFFLTHTELTLHVQ
jgi:hypothetical protein